MKKNHGSLFLFVLWVERQCEGMVVYLLRGKGMGRVGNHFGTAYRRCVGEE